ncbi:MAG: DegT/DnrJ/EryC1/StrS family aminotransferase, partial [Planctomycetes bacterium]|nr:DegT/DnrJ/EryC1/StrS family aminotransferase [Planctomycetota bacterium]
AEGRRHVYHQYSILCDRRDDLVAFLKERGVGSGIYYPRPLHLQECFESLGYRAGDLPVAERVCSRVVSLPCHPMLDEEDVRYVAGCIAEFSEITGGGDQPRTAAADLTV